MIDLGWTAYAAVFVVQFVHVAARAFQQLNVTSKRYLAIFPTSLVMSIGDYTLPTLAAYSGYQAVAHQNWWSPPLMMLCLATSASMGTTLSMKLDDRRIKNGN